MIRMERNTFQIVNNSLCSRDFLPINKFLKTFTDTCWQREFDKVDKTSGQLECSFLLPNSDSGQKEILDVAVTTPPHAKPEVASCFQPCVRLSDVN